MRTAALTVSVAVLLFLSGCLGGNTPSEPLLAQEVEPVLETRSINYTGYAYPCGSSGIFGCSTDLRFAFMVEPYEAIRSVSMELHGLDDAYGRGKPTDLIWRVYFAKIEDGRGSGRPAAEREGGPDLQVEGDSLQVPWGVGIQHEIYRDAPAETLLGHPISLTVSVVLEVDLERKPVLNHLHENVTYEGNAGFCQWLLNPDCRLGNTLHEFPFEGRLEYVNLTLEWSATTPATEEIRVWFRCTDPDGYYCESPNEAIANGTSPLVINLRQPFVQADGGFIYIDAATQGYIPQEYAGSLELVSSVPEGFEEYRI